MAFIERSLMEYDLSGARYMVIRAGDNYIRLYWHHIRLFYQKSKSPQPFEAWALIDL